MRTLSYTQISQYLNCPLCYKLQYVDGLKPAARWYFSFGKVLHACAEHFYRVRVPPPPSQENLLAFYEASWLSEGYDSPEEEERYKVYGREILSEFWKIHSHKFKMPVAVEKLFHIDIDGVKLRGFIDRVDKLDGGGLSIVDYKSSSELFSREDLDDNLQLTLYQIAAQQTWHIPVQKLSLYHLRSNTSCECGPRTESQLDEAKNLVIEVASKIAAAKFPATENQYCPCDFAEHCPYYKHKYSIQPAIESSPAIEPAEAVERYVSLQNQIKALEDELETTKHAIIEFCEREQLSRIYGKEHAITYRAVDRFGFDENEVRALFEPAGLLGQVLSFDQSKLKELIESGTLPADIRRRLEALKQVISTSPRLWVKKIAE